MDVVQLPNVGRRAFCLSVVGVLALAGGCGDATSTPAKPEDTKAKEEAERAARQKAFGPSGVPGKTKAKPKG